MEKRVLGDYTIIKKIGAGSLGTTFLAEHKYFKKQYAIKVLPEELTENRAFVQRFEEEIGQLSALEHPNIVKIHNVSYADGKYFIVSDCIVDDMGETTNLQQWLLSRGGQLESSEIETLLLQLGSALNYAHEKNMIHRSIKLNNILVGKGPHFALSDFGLSRIIGVSAVLTRTFHVVAETAGLALSLEEEYPNPPVEGQKFLPIHTSFLQNYAFLAPEQKNIEKLEQVNKKADLYAMGVLLYYLVMREYPEGYFPLPTEPKWSSMVKQLLQFDSANRPEGLLEVMGEEVQLKQVVSVETTEPPKPIIQTSKLERPELDEDPAQAFIVDTTVKHYSPKRAEKKQIEPILSEMAVINGGEFYRGSNEGNRDEMPYHKVRLKSFALDVHPVTNEQFSLFLETMGGEKDSNHNDLIRLRDSRIKRAGGRLSIESGYSKHPAVGVTWYGATAYANWVGKRLPTEAEWEIAGYGDGVTSYPAGDDVDKTKANYFSSDTTPVKSYPPNPFGLYDMAGNVYEWCSDWYGYNFYETSQLEPDSPSGPLQGVYRVIRGGCWKSLKEDLRCSHRHRNNPGTVNSTYGFRLATDVSS